MAYAEFTHGTVEEYEAMESTVMNRIASGHKYWVDRDKSYWTFGDNEAPDRIRTHGAPCGPSRQLRE